MTENNFFTHIQKWSVYKADTTEPPKFFRQSFDLADKTFVPYDELSSWKNAEPLQNLIPHFFIEDYKQTCFADNPLKHSKFLYACYAQVAQATSKYFPLMQSDRRELCRF